MKAFKKKFKELVEARDAQTPFDMSEAQFNNVMMTCFSVVLNLVSEATDAAMLPVYAAEDSLLFWISLGSLILTVVMRLVECAHLKLANLVEPGNLLFFMLSSFVFVVSPEAGMVLIKTILVSSTTDKNKYGYVHGTHSLTHEV